MSDHHYKGGHELEAINSGALFKLGAVLIPVTLIACIVVVQWFYKQRDELILERASEKGYMLAKHDEQMAKELQGVDGVAKKVAADASLLAANDPPAGWIHPDDIGKTAEPEEAAAEAPAGDPAEDGADTEGAEDGAEAEGDDDAKEDAKADADGDGKKDDAKKDDAKKDDAKKDDAKKGGDEKGDDEKGDKDD